MNTAYKNTISKVISISTTPMVLFTSDLNIVTANTRGREMLRSYSSVCPIVRKTLFVKRQVTKTIRFSRKTFVLSSCPILEKENVTGALVTAKENKIKRRQSR